ncbi:MAG: class I SAM-dependent methyltransferase [Candidatus Niyogibacteria bacterium]|nr:class I SAM-dependent methyltransferase [Candidatus Niyogibacteria bacterium]
MRSSPKFNPKPKTKQDTSWGEVAEWYHDLLSSNPDSYQAKVILPNLLRLMKIGRGEQVADIACGEGFFARAMQLAGATVTATDISPELIAIARKSSPKEINYNVASAHDLGWIKNGSVDKVTIVLGLQNIADAGMALAESARILKSGGKLYLILNHPAFRIPKGSSWGFDEEKNVQYRRVDGYLYEKKVEIEMRPGSDKSVKTVSFHRPLQYYFKQLHGAGLAITRLEEWISHKKSESGPRAKAEDLSRKEIPLFLCLEATKI